MEYRITVLEQGRTMATDNNISAWVDKTFTPKPDEIKLLSHQICEAAGKISKFSTFLKATRTIVRGAVKLEEHRVNHTRIEALELTKLMNQFKSLIGISAKDWVMPDVRFGVKPPGLLQSWSIQLKLFKERKTLIGPIANEAARLGNKIYVELNGKR